MDRIDLMKPLRLTTKVTAGNHCNYKVESAKLKIHNHKWEELVYAQR